MQYVVRKAASSDVMCHNDAHSLNKTATIQSQCVPNDWTSSKRAGNISPLRLQSLEELHRALEVHDQSFSAFVPACRHRHPQSDELSLDRLELSLGLPGGRVRLPNIQSSYDRRLRDVVNGDLSEDFLVALHLVEL